MKNTALATMCLSVAIGVWPAATEAKFVKCPKESIQAAIDAAVPPATIEIKGICTENVVINKDDIVLTSKNKTEPQGGSGTVAGKITVKGARRVSIEFLNITGPDEGIIATDNASITVKKSIVSNNLGHGILLMQGASAVIHQNRIIDTVKDLTPSEDPDIIGTPKSPGNFGSGITILGGSSAKIVSNYLLDNDLDGITVFGSFARVFLNVIEGNGQPAPDFGSGILVFEGGVVASFGNQIRNNGYAALDIVDNSVFRNQMPAGGSRDVIEQGTGQFGIEIFNGSRGDFRALDFTGQIEVIVHSTIRVGNIPGKDAPPDDDSVITGNINISRDSNVQLRTDLDFFGTLSCFDTSFATGDVACGQTCAGRVSDKVTVPAICSP